MEPTIKDIAKLSNVSIATVSRIINDLGGYSASTQKKVQEVIDQLGYSKNANATSLVTKRSHTLGVVIPNVNTGFYGDIVNGIEDQAYENGYSVILTHAGVEGKKLVNSLKLMAARRVDGLIIVSINLTENQIDLLNKMGLPTVLLSTKSKDKNLPFIKVDDYAAIYDATKHLILKKHHRVGLAGVNESDPVAGKPRIKGYLDCLNDFGIPIDKELIVPGDFSFDAGKKAMEYYLKKDPLPSAIVSASDETALGIISVAKKHSIDVPHDLSVMGYDDTNIAVMVTPSLTTVKQPFYEMGDQGCASIIKFIEKNEPIKSQILPFQLMERETVGELQN